MIVNSGNVRKFLRELAQTTKTNSLNEAEAAARAAQQSAQDAVIACLSVGAKTGWSISLGGLDLVVFEKDGGFNVVGPGWSVIMRPDYEQGLENLKAELDGGPETEGTPDICDAFGNQAAFYRDVTMLMLHGVPA